jgi:hypothetical protein
MFCLLFLGVALLLFSVAMWIFKADEKVDKVPSIAKCIRRAFYSIWVIACAMVIAFSPSTEIQLYGRNPLGFSPEACLLVVLLLGGVLVEIFVVTADPLQSFSFGSAKIETKNAAATAIEKCSVVVNDLSDKVYAQYAVISDLKINGLAIQPGYDPKDVFQGALDRYIDLQDDDQTDQSVELVDMQQEENLDGIAKKYDLANREKCLISRNMSGRYATDFEHNGEWFAFIPYECAISDSILLVILMSKKQISDAEAYLVLGILEHVEDYLIDIL